MLKYFRKWNNIFFNSYCKILQGTQPSRNRYLALGISDDMQMPNSDIYAGFLLGTNGVVVQDRFVLKVFSFTIYSSLEVTEIWLIRS